MFYSFGVPCVVLILNVNPQLYLKSSYFTAYVDIAVSLVLHWCIASLKLRF